MPTIPSSPGTVTVTNASATITGTGTAFTLLRAGDCLVAIDGSFFVMLASDPTADGSATITDAWGGATASNKDYFVVARAEGAQVAATIRALLATMQSTNALATAGYWGKVASTTEQDPGAGGVGLNHATPGSATAIYLSDTDGDGNDWGDVFDALTAGSRVIVQSTTRPHKRGIFALTSETDETGWHKFVVTFLGGNATLDWQTDERLIILPVQAGPQGVTAGYRLTMDAASTADSDPGAGKVRFNHATFASITYVYVDNADAEAVSITTFLDSLDDAANANARAYLRFEKTTDPAVYAEFAVTGVVVDGTGYRKIPVSPIAGSVPANSTALVMTARASGDDGADGTGMFSRVRAVAASNITIATALNNGDTIDGVVLATNDLVLVAGQTAPAENGIYVVGVTPARDTSFDTYDEHPGVYVSVMEGTTYADTLWRCTSNKGGTLGVTAIALSEVAATTTGRGLVELATDAEAQALADSARAVTPSNLAALVATQANQEAGTALDRFVPPGRQQFHPSAVKFWCCWNASGAIQQSYNVTSVTDSGVGDQTVTIATDFSAATWALSCGAGAYSGGLPLVGNPYSKGAGSVSVAFRNPAGTLTDPSGPTEFYAGGMGDQ